MNRKETAHGHGREESRAAKAPDDGRRFSTAAKAFRAVNAVVVFGIPLLVGTAALAGYGVRAIYKRVARRNY